MSKQKINYKKTHDRIKNQQKALNKENERVKCLCPHRKDGQATLVRRITDEENESAHTHEWVCYQCEKVVNLKRISEEELRNAIDTIDRAIDVIKFSCKQNNERDLKFHSKVSKTQYRIRNMIDQAYRASLNENDKRNNRRHNRQNSAKWI